MKSRFLKAVKVKELLSSVDENLESYRTGNFDYLANDSANFFETELEIDEEKISQISCDNVNHKEVESCMLIYQSMGNVSHYLARDERLWTYLTHTLMLRYVRNRWPIPEDNEKAIKHIKSHFFCIGARGIERDNAASRLWWMASLCGRSDGLPLDVALTCLLYQYDVRANIIERPTTSQNIQIFSAILKKLYESYKSDKKLFERERFRAVMKWLNLAGGVRLLGALPEIQLLRVLEESIERAA